MDPWNNTQPDTPIIEGSTSGKVGESYNYTFMSKDPNGDYVWYHIC